MLLDNARAAGQVRPLLPRNPGCLVVVTSRDRLDGLTVHEGAHRLTVGRAVAGRGQHVAGADDRVAKEPAALAELARLCAYLPLALRLAAANLVARPPGLADHGGLTAYAARLAVGNRLTGLEVADDDGSAVRSAFRLSYATLPGAEARLFRLLGLLSGVDVTVAAAAELAGVRHEDAGRLLDRLAAAHLVYETVAGRFTFHDLPALSRAAPAATVRSARCGTGGLGRPSPGAGVAGVRAREPGRRCPARR